jgi:CheY-like chemotaxis protein
LIVDDEEGIRDFLRYTLGGLGCTVDDAEDGNVALEKISSIQYDYVFSDMIMPGMDGRTLIIEIHKLDLLRRPIRDTFSERCSNYLL